LADEAENTLRSKFVILEQQLAKTSFFGGESWDMSDFMVACVLYILTRLTLDMSRPYPLLDAWLKDSIERPAARRARKLRET
jgi:glutathione S-transferase